MDKIKKIAIDYFFIILGSFILALGINFFLVPLKISTGGVSGIGMVLFYVFKIPISLTTLVINIFLFFFGYKTLKKSSILKTLAGIVFSSLFLEITKYFGFYSDDILIASVFGGILVGVGVGLTVLKDAATGGSDFAALMLNKIIPHISIATFILIIDTVVILVSGIVFKDYTIMFYSVISLYISSKVTDFIMVSGDFAKSVYIISKNNKEIADVILKEMERGVTGIYSKGFSVLRDVCLCVFNKNEL